jgi:hypothetical protein
MHITPTQASATAVACALVFWAMIVCYNIGRANPTTQLRSACDVIDRDGLKAGYYTTVAR